MRTVLYVAAVSLLACVIAFACALVPVLLLGWRAFDPQVLILSTAAWLIAAWFVEHLIRAARKGEA